MANGPSVSSVSPPSAGTVVAVAVGCRRPPDTSTPASSRLRPSSSQSGISASRSASSPPSASGAYSNSMYWGIAPPSLTLSIRRSPVGHLDTRSALVALPDQRQPVQGQQVVGLVDGAAVRHARPGQPAGGQRAELAQLLVQALDDPVDHPGEPVER